MRIPQLGKLRTRGVLNHLRSTALPLPRKFRHEDLPYSVETTIGQREYRFVINYNYIGSYFTLAVYLLPLGDVLLEPHPLVYLSDTFSQFQYKPALRGLHVVPFNLGNPNVHLRDGITWDNFGNAVKLWYYFNAAEAQP